MAVHFTTMLCEPKTIKYKESHILAIFVLVLTTLCMLGVEDARYINDGNVCLEPI